MPINKAKTRLACLTTTLFFACAPLVGAAPARQDEPGVVAVSADGAVPALPRIETHAPAGFRLYRAGYRFAGKGVLVSVQLCRIPGWAAPSPSRLLVEHRDTEGQTADSSQAYVPRLGMRAGNNCSFASVRLPTVPTYGDVLKVCALYGGDKCP